MRKLYPRIILGVLFVLASIVSLAQVSVTATAGTTGPTSYTTLKASFDAINAGTHSGAVTVTITGNTTEPALALLRRPASGSGSSYTSVMIKPGAGATPTITRTGAGMLMMIHGSNVTIDGSNNGTTSRDLTLSLSDTSEASTAIIGLFNSGLVASTNNTIKNSVLRTGYYGILALDSAGTNGAALTNFTIQNNNFQNLQEGIFIIGDEEPTTGNNSVITQNLLNSTGTNALYDYGISVEGVSGVSITKNDIGNFNSTQAGVDEGLYIGFGTKNLIVDANKISNLGYTGSDGYGAHAISVRSGLANANIRISNNMISNIFGDGWDFTTQFYRDNPMASLVTSTTAAPQSGVTIAFNSIHMYGNTLNQTNAISVGIFLEPSATAIIQNNIIVNNLGINTTGFGSLGVWATGTTTNVAGMNYNDVFVSPTGTGVKYLAVVGTNPTNPASYATNLAQLMTVTGANANSRSVLPVFVSQTDLHLIPGSNPQLEDSGAPVTGVSTDFDGDTRSTTPDIGADEIISACTAPVITTQPSAATACSGNNTSFTVAATGTGLTYQWKKDGVNVAGATSANYSLTNLTAAQAGSYTVTISNSCGTVTSNVVTLTVNATPTAAFTTTLNQCVATNYTYTNGSTAGATFIWNFGDGTPNSTAANPNHTYAAAGNYVVTLTATVNGCTASTTRNVAVTICTALPNVDESISGVRIMPNLVSSDAVLRVVASRSSNISWSITDEQGRVVMKFTRAANAGQNDINLSLSRLPSGIYQLNGLTSKGVTETVRFVKK